MATDIPQTTIDELRRLSAAATPGPWQAVKEFINDSHHMNVCRANETVSFRSSGKSVGDGPESRGPNQELIIALRNNIDALLTALESVQANERRAEQLQRDVDELVRLLRWAQDNSNLSIFSNAEVRQISLILDRLIGGGT